MPKECPTPFRSIVSFEEGRSEPLSDVHVSQLGAARRACDNRQLPCPRLALAAIATHAPPLALLVKRRQRPDETTATLAPLREAELAFEVPGGINARPAELGQRVEPGQELLTLYPRRFKIQKQLRNAEL